MNTSAQNEYLRQYRKTHQDGRVWMLRPERKRWNEARRLRGVASRAAEPKHHQRQWFRKLDKLKGIVFMHYGNGQAACVECGVADMDVLTLDHINNDGNVDRLKWRHPTGHGLYRSLKVKGFPPGYQTMCANCNMKKAMRHRRELAMKRVENADRQMEIR